MPAPLNRKAAAVAVVDPLKAFLVRHPIPRDQGLAAGYSRGPRASGGAVIDDHARHPRRRRHSLSGASEDALASYKSRVCEVNAWTALYGRLRRAQLTSEHVRKARATWIEGKVAPKTVNNRGYDTCFMCLTASGRRHRSTG